MSTELDTGMNNLVVELVRRLALGESFDNPKLTQIADQAFGGTRAQGVFTPRDAYDALETAVNKHLLETEAQALMSMNAEAFAILSALTDRLATQTDRTLEQTEFQQFSTPPTLAFLAAKLLDLQPGDIVLEPSAGTGSLAIWPRSFGARVVCNEINPRRRALLTTELGFETYDVDAEIIDDVLPAEIRPTLVLMNPPFTATGGRVVQHHAKYGLRHIESALRRLSEGGRLVAIAGENVAFQRSAVTGWWQKMAATYNVRANFGLSGKVYRKYGTNWGVQVLVIDKVGATPGGNWQRQLSHIVWGSADSVEDTWASLRTIPQRTINNAASEADAKDDGAQAVSSVFVPYVPAKLRGGVPHPSTIVESASMASVTPPNVTYRPRLPIEVIKEGKLSIIQLERVIYAGQRHEQRLPDGARGGFYVGDGTGVGKGRVLAGIIVDNWFQNRRRALWLSVNNDLLESTRRDLNDLGVRIPLAQVNDYPAAGDITAPCGVIFSSYSSLISTAKSGAKRLDQIQKWLGREPVIILDEAHKAKNALASGRGEPTQTGQAVIDLQDPKRNSEYRVVYSSATGATDVRNMAYMTRLGLWGPGTNFAEGFTQFLAEIDSGGVGAMEMASRDMKSLGMYLSGSISFGVDPASGKAVEYRARVHPLTAEQRKMYNHAAKAWRVVLQNVEAALNITNSSSRARGNALQKFWGDHQRFFRQVICAFKVPSVIEEAEAALGDGKSVVISMVGTGEAKTREQISRVTADGGTLEDLDFSPREVIAAMIERGFPTALYRDETDKATGQTIKVLATDKSGSPVQSQEALRMKQGLLDGLSALHLPENPLDQLVNHFGEKNVAELTGRTRRLIRDPHNGRVEYKKRAPEGVPMHRVNVDSTERFQGAKCRVAIISDAGSIGISLHSSNRAQNRERRVHITLELGWSADKQMQCFGRTHRSDQAVPPEYILLSTELGGEKRFSSTIARRLASLGALTKGDRGAADNADWQRYNFETEEGKSALCLMYKRIVAGEIVKGLTNPKHTLRDIGLLVVRDGVEQIRKEDEYNVPRFLNRILALDVEEQNALFDYFADLFDQTVRYAKASGTFDEGVTDIRALAIRVAKPPVVVHVDRVTGAETVLYILEVDRPSDTVPFDRAERLRINNDGAFLQHQKKGDYVLVLPSGRHTDPSNGTTFLTYSVWRPEAARTSYIREQDVKERYRVVRPDEPMRWWNARYAAAPAIETSAVHIIAGAIIPLWHKLKTEGDSKLHVIRVCTKDGQRIVGVEIPPKGVGKVLRSLGLGSSASDPQQVFTAVLQQGEQIDLTSNLRLKRSTLQREPAIELVCVDCDRFQELRELGLINEQIKFKQRFFVPTDEKKGLPILTKLLDRYPVMEPESPSEQQEPESLPVIEGPEAAEFRMVDLEQWVLPPDPDVLPEASYVEDSMPLAFIAADVPALLQELPIQTGPSLITLLEQHSQSVEPRRGRKQRPRVEEQGLLFSLQ
jgi:predicted RNA methylase